MSTSDANSAARLHRLFNEALRVDDGAARQRWIEALREHSPTDATAIERLLARDRDSTDPFSGAIDRMRRHLEHDDGEWIGRVIGGFRIRELLGSGGSGSVFLAERQMRDFQQLVALKLLRALWLDASVLKHFTAERQILARLRHPCIASLIDAGSTADGRPYLAMEYVEGTTLACYCDEGQLDVRARIKLARLLLGALGHAHRQLVVHRDLKPGNVLVTADGTPKLLDFGIAHLVNPESGDDATTTRAMTPGYASPEQLAGEPAGTPSDLYSFGLIVYELCVGVLPWDADARPTTDASVTSPSQRFRHLDGERREALAASRASTPARVRRMLHGDLGRILGRCLDPNPARRYASADALDTDLAALLASRPPPGVQVPPLERALTFGRRHAWPLALTAVLIVATATLLVQSLLAAKHLEAQRDRAVEAATAAKVEAAKSRQIAEFTQAMLSGINPDQARGLDRSLMRLVLDQAAERARTELAGQPEVRAAIERTIGQSYNAIGEYALAVKHLSAAIAATGKLPDSLPQLVALRTRKARSLSNTKRHDEAVETMRRTVEQAAALPARSRQRMYAESTYAGLQCDLGHYQKCRDLYAEVYPRQKQVLGASDGQTLSSALGLAAAEDALGHASVAQKLYREVLAARRAESQQPTSYVFAAVNALAISYLRQDQFVEAEALLKPALAKAKSVFGPEHPIIINMRSNLGGAIRQQPGRNAEARPYYEKTLAAARARFGTDSKRTAFAEMNLALLLRDAGDLDAALAHAQASLDSSRRILPTDSPIFGMILTNVASMHLRRGELAAARKQLDKAWQILQHAKGFGPDHPWVRDTAGYYAKLYAAMGQPRKAAQWRQRAGLEDAGDHTK